MRLKGQYPARSIKGSVLFQFQTGAIKRQKVFDAETDKDGSFNSKLVRLKVTNQKKLGCKGIGSFNSKLVRLKASLLLCKLSMETFQFQTGAIKRIQPKEEMILLSTFQFQTGAIKRICRI